MKFFVSENCRCLKVPILSAAILLIAIHQGASQTSAPSNVEVVDIPLPAWTASRDHALPGSLSEFATDDTRRKQFGLLIERLADKDWDEARKLASSPSLKYQLVAIRELNDWFVIASDDSGEGRDPTVIINLTPRRDVIFEAPHVPFERGTAEQAAILLRELGGRAAIVSGAHRCASKKFTTCDGTTPVCGSIEGYRDSDVGHNTNTLFHLAHTVLAERWNKAIVVSLHGMLDDNSGVRTSLIVSNGIRAPDSNQKTPGTKFRLGLDSLMTPPGTAVSCNWPSDAAYNHRPLCGYTNVQGRHVNGDADACRDSMDQGTDRFIHLEQDWSILRPFAQNWSRINEHQMGNAMIKVFEVVLPPI